MSRSSSADGAPRARRDPIVTSSDALAVVELARCRRPREEIIAFLLDDAMRGTGTILSVHHVHTPADVLAVAELMGEAGASAAAIDVAGASSLVVASVRLQDRASSLLDDVDLWQQMSDLTEQYGIILLEWFVLGPMGVSCPRDILGEPDRWPR